jgi:signal transduction histidine kinase
MTVLEFARAFAVRRPHGDLFTAAVVFAVTLLTTFGVSGTPADSIAVGTAAVAAAALAARRRFPVTVLVVSTLAAEAFVVHVRGTHGTAILAAPLIALYTVAEASTRRRAVTIGILAVLAFGGLHMFGRPTSWIGAENVALAALGGLAVAAGHAARSRREYLAEVEARARHAEADRDAEAARRVTEERLRIARDLHDAVGHQLALIHVQAGVAEHALADPPLPATEALRHIRVASRTALAELTDTVGLLRRPGESTAPVEPIAGLDALDELLATFRRTGLAITTRIIGTPRPLGAAVDLTAYRVVQEALTNVCKHAGPTTVDIEVSYSADAVRLTVDNASTATVTATDAPGHGLIGMRERITALGGTLDAAPRHGRYRVRATLPLSTP